jgi:hypothetical protein
MSPSTCVTAITRRAILLRPARGRSQANRVPMSINRSSSSSYMHNCNCIRVASNQNIVSSGIYPPSFSSPSSRKNIFFVYLHLHLRRARSLSHRAARTGARLEGTQRTESLPRRLVWYWYCSSRIDRRRWCGRRAIPWDKKELKYLGSTRRRRRQSC